MPINVYEIVTSRILDQLDKGVIPWRKTWNGSEPRNYITQKTYRGINLLLLPFGGEYATFKQIKEAGGYVKKGEKSHMIVFFKMMENQNGETGELETFPYLKYSNVFHISQCEGIESKREPISATNNNEPAEAAQTIIDGYISRTGVKIDLMQGSNKACYSPVDDTITMPVIGQFDTSNDFYSVFFHEAAHSTGHETRLKRLEKAAAFGSHSYSKEELVSEIAACMLMNFTQIEIPETFENSVSYIKSWSAKLKEDKKMIVTAANAAQKATDLILGITEEAGQ